jgi:hypothetical protein
LHSAKSKNPSGSRFVEMPTHDKTDFLARAREKPDAFRAAGKLGRGAK